jgi:SAM-dependent methyltransferase
VFRRVVLLNTFEQATKSPFVSVIADARDLSQYSEDQFDLVFSNSVIGHVGGFDDQLRMAREVMRVGKHFFLQTPNHGFPIDWRTLVPFFHFLPVNAQAWCFERFSVGKYRQTRDRNEAFHLAARVRNIRRGDIDTLFPNANIEVERVLGLTKSFMIHNLPCARESRIHSAVLLPLSALGLESEACELATQLMALV